ncbi:MAG: stage III sporulation protein AF [Clostridia bacterium]|nr:stage III sporulation protein AF [Clostridia bacterium]MDD4048925.1 stage III sporulation protein AF [Clostridia bacterium]
MNVLIDMVRNVVVIILLTTFLDMILPSNSMQRFIKVIMGLFVLVSLLNPIINIISEDKDFETFTWQYNNLSKNNSVLEQSKKLQEVNEKLLRQNYKQRIEGQMKTLVQLIKDVNKVEVQVKFDSTNNKDNPCEQISKVTVIIGSKIEDKRLEPQFVETIKIKVVEVKKEGENKEQSSIAKIENEQMNKNMVLDKEKETIKCDILDTLCYYFGLRESQISVIFS